MPNTTPSVSEKEQTRRLTLKQRKFIDHYLEHGNATDAAMHAYNCKDRTTAGAVGYEALRSLEIQRLMEDFGLTDQKLLSTLKKGLDATKPIGASVLVSKDGKLIRAEDEGAIEVEDHTTRHKYLETALKLKKHLAVPGTAAPVAVQVNTIVEGDRSKFT